MRLNEILNINMKKILPYLFLALFIYLLVDFHLHILLKKKEFVLTEAGTMTMKISNEDIERKLRENRIFLYLYQSGAVNQDSSEINFDIWSVKEIYDFKLSDFTIAYDDKEVKIKRNISYKLQTGNPDFFHILNMKDGEKDTEVYKYSVFGGFEKYKICKINFKKLFSKKQIDFGESFPVKIIVHFYLDGEEFYQELNYTCECRKETPYPPNWFMMIFPYY